MSDPVSGFLEMLGLDPFAAVAAFGIMVASGAILYVLGESLWR